MKWLTVSYLRLLIQVFILKRKIWSYVGAGVNILFSWTSKNKSRTLTRFSKHLPSGPMLSISQNVRLFVRLLSVRLFTFEVPFKRLFTPTSRSWMSNIFRVSESLGKSNGKNWSQIGTFWFGSGLKSPRKKNSFSLILPFKTWWKPHFPMD